MRKVLDTINEMSEPVVQEAENVVKPKIKVMSLAQFVQNSEKEEMDEEFKLDNPNSVDPDADRLSLSPQDGQYKAQNFPPKRTVVGKYGKERQPEPNELDEATGDKAFDNMLANIVGKAGLGNPSDIRPTKKTTKIDANGNREVTKILPDGGEVRLTFAPNGKLLSRIMIDVEDDEYDPDFEDGLDEADEKLDEISTASFPTVAANIRNSHAENQNKKPLATHKSGCAYNYGHDCTCGGTLTHASNCDYNYGHDCDCGLKESELAEADDKMLGAKTQKFAGPDMENYFDKILDKSKEKGDKFKKPYIHGGNVPIVNKDGQKYDLNKLRDLITQRPPRLLKQNEKMQHSDGTSSIFYNVGLPALKGLAVDEETGEFVIVDTCPGAGACKTFCYAMKGGYVQWPAASLSQTRVLNFLLNDPKGFSVQLAKELARAEKSFGKQGTKVIVRWHDAGDFFSPQYLALAYNIARQFPNVDFYAYTKLADVAQGANKPDNFRINFSMGAKPSEERRVDFKQAKHSKVVPKELFSDIVAKKVDPKTGRESLVKDANGKVQFSSPENLEVFKQRLGHKYSINPESILTYDQMMRNPKGEKPIWNVIVMPGDGDDSANRADVIGSYLLFH